MKASSSSSEIRQENALKWSLRVSLRVRCCSATCAMGTSNADLCQAIRHVLRPAFTSDWLRPLIQPAEVRAIRDRAGRTSVDPGTSHPAPGERGVHPVAQPPRRSRSEHAVRQRSVACELPSFAVEGEPAELHAISPTPVDSSSAPPPRIGDRARLPRR